MEATGGSTHRQPAETGTLRQVRQAQITAELEEGEEVKKKEVHVEEMVKYAHVYTHTHKNEMILLADWKRGQRYMCGPLN